jgi:G:T-mismatch repair DNA endonuclease (very short patch repair protein)
MTTYHSSVSLPVLPKGHWEDITNRRKFIELLGVKHNFSKPDDYYHISTKMVKEFGGGGLLAKYYAGSAIKLVKHIVSPDLKEWLFDTAPQGYWNIVDNVRIYLNWLFALKGFTHLDDWYNITPADFLDNKGNGLLDKYNYTISSILTEAYPDTIWYPWLFRITTKGTWKNKENHSKYIKWLEERLSITDPSDWYKYDATIIVENKGCGLLQNEYNHSLTKLLSFVYPDYDFKMYRFGKTPTGYWDIKDNITAYLNDLYTHKEFRSIVDWYSISFNDFKNFFGGGLLDKYGNSAKRIVMENITYDWNEIEFTRATYSLSAIDWLDKLSVSIGIPIRHILNHPDGEYVIPETNYKADGFLEYMFQKIILEFHGCPFHGCDKCFPMRNSTLYSDGITYQERFDRTKLRTETIKSLGFVVIEIWSCEYSSSLDVGKWFREKFQPYCDTILSESPISTLTKPIYHKTEYKCESCAFTTTKKPLYDRHLISKSHIAKVTPKIPKIHKCCSCEYETQYKSNLNRHKKTKH